MVSAEYDAVPFANKSMDRLYWNSMFKDKQVHTLLPDVVCDKRFCASYTYRQTIGSKHFIFWQMCI